MFPRFGAPHREGVGIATLVDGVVVGSQFNFTRGYSFIIDSMVSMKAGLSIGTANIFVMSQLIAVTEIYSVTGGP